MALITEEDKRFMKRCIRELLDRTFIIRDLERDKKMYRFISNHLEDATEYLLMCGYEVKKQDDLGVIMISQEEDAAENAGLKRKNLKKFTPDQVRVLLVLWELYLSRSLLDKEVFTTVGEINETINTHGMSISPQKRESALILFKRFKLVGYIGDERSEETKIEIYPSIQFAMPTETLRIIRDELMNNLKGETDEDIISESEDEDQGEE